MAEPITRQKVNNPFQMGPSQQVQMPGRLREESKVLPRSAFQAETTGIDIVNALVGFTGAAADQYTKKMNKKIATDKIIQSGVAAAGAAPTSEATVAGTRAHAAVTLKSEMLGVQARLNELAKQGLDDEEWEKAIQDEYRAVDNYMLDTYEGYAKDQEMQKLVPISFREAMPQVASVREADKIKRKEASYINSVTDALLNMDKLAKENGHKVPVDAAVTSIDRLVKGNQLTSLQKDEAITKAILTSKSPSLIEASKVWKGDRKTSLYERTGALQALDEKLQGESLSNEAVSLAVEFNTYKSQILSGELALDTGLSLIDRRNKELNGKFATRGSITSIINDHAKAVAGRERQRQIKALLADQSQTDATSIKPKERQAGYTSIYQDLINQAREEAKEIPEEEQGEFLKKKTASAIAQVCDMAVTKDDVINPFVKSLSNLATSNVAARQKVGDKGELTLDSTTEQAINILDSMPPMAKYQHLDSLGGKESKVVRAFMAYRDRGIPDPQALTMAQGFLNNPYNPDTSRISKGVEEVRDNLEFLLNPDFEDSQSAYLEEEIRNQVSLSPEPDDDSNIDLVTEYFKKGWTTAGHLRLKGSIGYLSKAIGLDPNLPKKGAKLEDMMRGVVWSQRDTWMPQLQALGLDEEDVFPITDPKRGTIQLVARSKASNANIYLGKPMPLSKVKDMAAQYKVRQEKIADEVEELGHTPFEVNQQNVITDFEEEKAKMRALYSKKKRSMNVK